MVDLNVKISAIPGPRTFSSPINESSINSHLSKVTIQSVFQTLTATFEEKTPNQYLGGFSKLNFRAAKYVAQFSCGTKHHAEEFILTHDDTEVYIISYSSVYSDEILGEITSDILNNEVRILITPTNINTKVTIKGYLIPV